MWTILVEGIVRLLRSDCTQPVNLGNPHELSVRAFAETIIRLTGSSSPIAFEPLPVDDPKVRQPDVSAARRTLDWEPRVALEDGLSKNHRLFPGKAGGRLDSRL